MSKAKLKKRLASKVALFRRAQAIREEAAKDSRNAQFRMFKVAEAREYEVRAIELERALKLLDEEIDDDPNNAEVF